MKTNSKEPNSLPNRMPGETFLSLRQAGEYCGGLAVSTLRRAIANKELRRFKAGKRKHSKTLVALSDLQKFIREVA